MSIDEDTTDPEIHTENGWNALERDERSSTISYFVGGAECVVNIGEAPVGSEVLVWLGVEAEDGSYDLTSHLGNEVPEDAQYIIEVHREELVDEVFATSRAEAFGKASEQISQLHAGQIVE